MDVFLKTSHAPTSLQMLTRYRAWAVDLTTQSLTEVPDEELVRPRQTTFGTILGTITHIHIVDEIFKAHLEGRVHGHTSRRCDDPADIRDLRSAMRDMSQWIIDISDRSSPADLAKEVTYRSVDAEPNKMTVEQILYHLINHATCHIGYVSDMMYQVPVEPPTTDLTVFVRDIWCAT